MTSIPSLETSAIGEINELDSTHRDYYRRDLWDLDDSAFLVCYSRSVPPRSRSVTVEGSARVVVGSRNQPVRRASTCPYRAVGASGAYPSGA